MSRSNENSAERNWHNGELKADETAYRERLRSARTGHILVIIIAVIYLIISSGDLILGNKLFAAVKIGVSVFLLTGKSAARWVYCFTAVLDTCGNIVRFVEYMNVIFAVMILYYIVSALFIVKSRSVETFYEMSNSNRY